MAKRTKISLTGFAALCLVISGLAFVRPPEDAAPIFPQFAMPSPINISNSYWDSIYPSIGVDSSGAAYVVWIEGNLIYFATDRTGQWSSPEVAYSIRYVTMDIDAAKSLAVGPNGVCHLFVQDGDPEATNYDVWHATYNNGWGGAEDISNTPEPSDAPSGAVNPADGSVICGWYDSTIHMWDIFLRYRSPSGSWGNVGILDSGYYADYRPEFVYDAYGRAHLVWYKRANGSSKVMYTRNGDPSNSSGWSSPIEVKGETGEDWALSKIDCDDAGNVYVVWLDASTGHDQIFFRKIFPDGSMSGEVNVSNSGGSPTNPDIGVNHATGAFLVVWEDNGQIYGNAWQGGWTGVQNITNSNARCTVPAVAVDNGGGIHLVYQQSVNGAWDIMAMSTSTGPPPTTTIGPSTTSTIGPSTTTIGPSTTTTSRPTTSTTSTTSTSTTSTTTTTSIPVHPKPPLNPALATQLDGSQTRKINALVWQRNPGNDAYALKNYRVWRKRANLSDLDFSVVAAVPPDTFVYVDGNLPLTEKYVYSLTTIPVDPFGQESEGSDYVSEIPVFAPLNAAVTTVTNKSLFRNEKINVVSWARDPLNDAVTILQYNIYRRKSGQTDSQFQKVGSVSAGVFEFRDRKLTADTYEYAVTVVDTSRFESARSNIVRESPAR